MPIRPVKEIVIPEKVFDKLWVSHIEISSTLNGEASAVVLMTPYNDSGESSIDAVSKLEIAGIMAKAQDKNSNIAKAMYFLLLAIDDEYKAQSTVQGE